VRVATGLPLRCSDPAVAYATGVPNKARTSAFRFFNCFTGHFVNCFPRFLCNRLIVATIPLDFALSGLIIVSLLVLVSELAIAQAVCQTLVVRKGLDYPIASSACQNGKKMRPVKSVESFDQKVGSDYLVFTEKHRLKRRRIHCGFFEFCTERGESTKVLSERECKRIAPHQHLSDFIARLFLLVGNFLQEYIVMSGCSNPIRRSCSGRRSALRFSSSRAISNDCQLFSSIDRRSGTSGSLPPSAAIFSAIHSACLLLSAAIWRSFSRNWGYCILWACLVN